MSSLVLEKLAPKDAKLTSLMQPVVEDAKIAETIKDCANELSETPTCLQDAATSLSNIKPRKQSVESKSKVKNPS